MEPLSLVLAALAAGATAGLSDTASAAVKDAYEGLRGLIARKLGDGDDAELVEYEADPSEENAAVLRARIAEIKAHHDEPIVEAARSVLVLARADQTGSGKFVNNIEGGVRGFVQGDHANVRMTFGDDDA
ncbi:hypothetical protein N5079_26670 [Planotetraspora sp. A-T 1434]|uniref:hypothetical protein n=1 Tax=Planotetraspora sp. A-T 1434 TaxID=2979219 RepID=UPI0021C1E74D|nr:hypothetical protein [Planotetraspora sp. A-T 1434]MCT9933803.1 hypothetical protein [Planotetraspora sp. A-T 1434]